MIFKTIKEVEETVKIYSRVTGTCEPFRNFLSKLAPKKHFSEDTYRTLTAVDSALMVVDFAKGVEERTIKLMEVCRLRDTPIMTFVNKLDREGPDSMEVMDEIESVLGIRCAPMTWPIGSGRQFSGIYRIYDDLIHLFARSGGGNEVQSSTILAS